jgi:chaperone required for assembly of F1-ATPase
LAEAVKRFWTQVALAEASGGWGIALDGRPLKTPARADLVVPTHALGQAIATEWRECGAEIDPRAMPMTGLANAALDHVAPRPAAFAADLAQYAEGDLLCYRADHPPRLIAAQTAAWDPLLAWARGRYTVDFIVTTGIIHAPQPATTIARLTAPLTVATPFQLAALSPLITIGGSLVTALALLDRALDFEIAWDIVSLDDRWQIEQWGADDEAVASLANRRREFKAAARFLALLD